MKSPNPLALLVSWLALVLGPAHVAQAADTTTSDLAHKSGSIGGRVQNLVTGQYLNKARVTVKGTDLVAFTDEIGVYKLANVPSGTVVLQIFYTGLDQQETALEVPAGQTIERDISLTSVARYGQNPALVKLDTFVVMADKETDDQAIATNEQRFAPNIKNVMATDSLGNIIGNNVGEFLKFIPGITAAYDEVDITGVSIRGIGGAMTSFTTNGAPIANATSTSSRNFNLNGVALNNTSRIEVTKVPTPASPADSLGGSINLVNKSAFERSKAELHVGLNLAGNSNHLTLGETPEVFADKNARKTRMGIDFEFIFPVSKNFGFTITGMQTNKFNDQNIADMTWEPAGTSTGASISRPYFRSHRVSEGPRTQSRSSLGFTADWRVSAHSVLSIGAEVNEHKQFIGGTNFITNAGNIGTPTPATGVPLSFGDDFTVGAAGRGTVQIAGIGNALFRDSRLGSMNYRFDDGQWKLETGISGSASRTSRRNHDKGVFSSINATLNPVVRITYSGINAERPGSIEAFDANNNKVDIYDIRNYRVTGASDILFGGKAGFEYGYVNLRRRLDRFSFPLSVQIGGSRRVQTSDVTGEQRQWNYAGVDGNTATNETPEPYRMQVYVNLKNHFGFNNIPWISTSRAWSAAQTNPNLFVQTPGLAVSQEMTRLTSSEFVQETVASYYLQAEASFFNNRLNVLTGVRFEGTTDEGKGLFNDPNAVFVRNADGSFAHDAAGNRIRKPEAGLSGSMEQLRLTHRERAASARRTYDGYFPSLHLNYSLKEDLRLRAAYARTYGRPNFTDIVPRTIVNEFDLTEQQLDDPTVIRGTLTVRNTALRPWSADNYDLLLEYYTPQGGMFSAGVFLKEIKNFFGDSVKVATLEDLQQLGVEPQYVGWNLSTKFNSGDARISGVEFNLRHSLRQLGPWGRYFTIFANGTKLRLEGNQQASFTGFVPETANWGFSFNRAPIGVTARWNYRGLERQGAQPLFGPDAYNYQKARTKLDLSLSYQMARHLSLAVSINNVFDVEHTLLRYGSQTPGYARQAQLAEYGVQFAVGLRGTF